MDAIAVCDFQDSAILEISIESSTRKSEKLIGRYLFNLDILERLAVLLGMVSSRRCLQFKREKMIKPFYINPDQTTWSTRPNKNSTRNTHLLFISVG
jgi:hypothetical protein